MKKNLVGSHWLLLAFPLWIIALFLYMATIGVIFFLRDHYEGLFYNTSFSSMLGDGALCAVVLMSAEILKRGALPPKWSQSVNFHFGAAIFAVLFGFIWWAHDRPSQWGDVYHHLFIASLLMYLAITLLPVIFGRGTRLEEIAGTILLISLWAGLVVFDAKHDRLAQRPYMSEHGISLTKAVGEKLR